MGLLTNEEVSIKVGKNFMKTDCFSCSHCQLGITPPGELHAPWELTIPFQQGVCWAVLLGRRGFWETRQSLSHSQLCAGGRVHVRVPHPKWQRIPTFLFYLEYVWERTFKYLSGYVHVSVWYFSISFKKMMSSPCENLTAKELKMYFPRTFFFSIKTS